jgi:hypothetical protein
VNFTGKINENLVAYLIDLTLTTLEVVKLSQNIDWPFFSRNRSPSLFFPTLRLVATFEL